MSDTLRPPYNVHQFIKSSSCSRQDMPPSGGFKESVPYKRHLPSRGPPGWLWLSAFTGIIATGFYLHSRGLRILNEIEREKRQARFALLPLLLAEQGAEEVMRRKEALVAEAEAMRGVPGWKVGDSVYLTDTQATRRASPVYALK